LHDTTDRIRWARHPETIVSHRGLIILIVSHSLAQQNLNWDNFIAPLEIGINPVVQTPVSMEIEQQNPVPKRKRTAHSKIGTHKRRRSTRLHPSERMFIDP